MKKISVPNWSTLETFIELFSHELETLNFGPEVLRKRHRDTFERIRVTSLEILGSIRMM